MDDGGLVVISAPANPFRCPPGPYERASLIAHHLKTRKPKSKLIVLDANDAFSKQRLFQQAWAELYPGLLECVPLSKGGNVTSVDASTRTLVTDFGRHQATVVNVIPPQRAGRIAEVAGVADRSGWCPIDPVTFESKLQTGIHVIGDAAIAGAMPKSAFAANSQAKTCAAAVARLLTGAVPSVPKLINTCYSLVAPDYGISIAGVLPRRQLGSAARR
jgi:NADPH-dependent 2,4-dienoyl-CoA reductase/sulfur reductase-like enzyme